MSLARLPALCVTKFQTCKRFQIKGVNGQSPMLLSPLWDVKAHQHAMGFRKMSLLVCKIFISQNRRTYAVLSLFFIFWENNVLDKLVGRNAAPEISTLRESPKQKKSPSGVSPFTHVIVSHDPCDCRFWTEYRRKQNIPIITGNLLCCADWTQGEKQPHRENDHGWSWLSFENLNQRI